LDSHYNNVGHFVTEEVFTLHDGDGSGKGVAEDSTHRNNLGHKAKLTV
jgi:hypothetical protein